MDDLYTGPTKNLSQLCSQLPAGWINKLLQQIYKCTRQVSLDMVKVPMEIEALP